MEMKRFFIHFIWLSMLCSSCGMGSTERERLTAERDSLAQEAAAIREELDGLKSYVDDVSECVDSISQSEGVLMINRDPETGRPYTRRELRERVKNFAGLASSAAEFCLHMENLAVQSAELSVSRLPESIPWKNHSPWSRY